LVRRLILGLDLVVSGDNVGVRGRYALAIGAALAIICDTLLLLLLLLLLLRRGMRRTTSVLSTVVQVAVVLVVGSAVVRLRLALGLLVLRMTMLVRTWWALDVDVGDAIALTILGESLVLVGRLGILRDDVP
jgi:lysylphosphatidylglycerol synthetase-like protein (DUF2156 family)